MARRKRKRKGTAKYIVIIVLLLIFIAGVIAYSHFGMTKEKADLNDYFSLSKGHAGPALYATLALKGFFPMEMLRTLNQPGGDISEAKFPVS